MSCRVRRETNTVMNQKASAFKHPEELRFSSRPPQRGFVWSSRFLSGLRTSSKFIFRTMSEGQQSSEGSEKITQPRDFKTAKNREITYYWHFLKRRECLDTVITVCLVCPPVAPGIAHPYSSGKHLCAAKKQETLKVYYSIAQCCLLKFFCKIFVISDRMLYN